MIKTMEISKANSRLVESEEDWVQVKEDTTFWNPEVENETIKGTIMDVKEDKWGNKQYKLFNAKEDHYYLTPSHTTLQALMSKVGINNVVKIEFKGSKDIGKGNPLKIYELWMKPMSKKDSL